ncbi:MAG: MBL fold metallo-hydrolase [Gemmatimonadetes bacterium]|nr:MBL fold metallo-hydrolase [Gemmatimonadota bacterium]
MRVCCLGSGSGGNSLLVEVEGTRVLVDAGFSARDLEARLASIDLEPAALDAILVTHDHSDHTKGVGVFARRHGTPVYLTERTRLACHALFRGDERTELYRVAHPFRLGGLRVEPFLTVHDAADPVGIALIDVATGARLGVATDLGRPTAGMQHALSSCDFLVLEANHDEVMLRVGPYPWSVKARIASSHGHLSNRAAARFVGDLVHPRLAGILLAHLSNECNDPGLAQEVVGTQLEQKRWHGWLGVAKQDKAGPMLDIETLRANSGPEQLSLL